jgi:hypothetical protein
MNASTHKLSTIEESLTQKVKQVKIMQDQLEANKSEIEDLTIQTKN